MYVIIVIACVRPSEGVSEFVAHLAIEIRDSEGSTTVGNVSHAAAKPSQTSIKSKRRSSSVVHVF